MCVKFNGKKFDHTDQMTYWLPKGKLVWNRKDVYGGVNLTKPKKKIPSRLLA